MCTLEHRLGGTARSCQSQRWGGVVGRDTQRDRYSQIKKIQTETGRDGETSRD